MHLYGGARQVLYLMAGLQARGINNTLICPRGSAVARAINGEHGGCVELPMTGDLDVGFLWRCRRLLRALQPDLLHVHSRRGADTYGGLAARAAGVPAVITRRVDNPERRSVARLKYRNYRAVIAISGRIRKLLIDDLGLSPDAVHLVPSAVDTLRFRPGADRARLLAALQLPPQSLLIGVIAQLIERKGHKVLLEALAPLLESQPGLKVLLFGQGPLAHRLERRIRRMGRAEQIRLMGFRHDLHELLPGMDLVVHPALTEGLGVALLEALASGVAVVASRVGGIVDLIEDGVHGRLVPAGDPAALRQAVAELLADPTLRARMGAAGRQRVATMFSLEQMVAGNLKVYEQVLS